MKIRVEDFGMSIQKATLTDVKIQAVLFFDNKCNDLRVIFGDASASFPFPKLS